MTLYEVIHAIEAIASEQPAVNMIVRNDVFRLNAVPDARYGVFAWLQGQHSAGIDEESTTFSFTFFYVDRLTSDHGNHIEVQSVGIRTLDNIIRQLDASGLSVSSAYSFTTFNQRFMDECAGVFCTVNIEAFNDCGASEDYIDSTVTII